MSAKGPSCPRCGSTRLGCAVTYRATGTGQVRGVNEHGEMQIDFFDGGDPEHFNAPVLECDDCGHYWRTKRPWTFKSFRP